MNDSGICCQFSELEIGNPLPNHQNFHQVRNSLISDTEFGEYELDLDNLDYVIKNQSLQPMVIEPFTKKDFRGDTLAHFYLYNGLWNRFEKILYKAPNPTYLNTVNDLNQTYLIVAGIINNHTIIRKLILSGVDVLVQDFRGNTVLHHSIMKGHDLCTQELLKRFSIAEFNNHFDTMSYRLTDWPRIPNWRLLNLPNDNGLSASHIATLKKNHAVLQMLWNAGGNMNAQCRKDGYRPLHLAIKNGDLETVKFLVGLGDVNIELGDFYNVPPLNFASACKKYDIVEFLVNSGACTSELFCPIDDVYMVEKE